MPLHLESIISEKKMDDALLMILKGVRTAEPFYASKDETIVHSRKRIKDIYGVEFGSIVYTFKIDQDIQSMHIIDIDIVLDGNKPTKLKLLNKLPSSSEANEYYDAEVVGQGGHLQIETVNRSACHKDIVETEQEVFLSAFPFSVRIYDDMEMFNKKLGFGKAIKISEDGVRYSGLAASFMAPASLLQMGLDSDETYTYFIGKVSSITCYETEEFGDRVEFFVVGVDSGMGTIPVIMSKECFDLKELALDKVLEIKADIKSDFSTYPPLQ